ncbi:TA system VapC family ribonuclease toxin [Ornithinimicrobium sp. Y1847]|uniref:TA system VapC family ribonuclease toxin n=1 Tax=unclassified Ornithinimicrobium TaxID=2615080 RepID=UPI003B66C421
MRIVDANVLIYAVNTSARQHEAARSWLTRALAGPESVGIPTHSWLAFLRITTRPHLLENPLTVKQATDLVEAWLHPPHVVDPPSPLGHHARVARLLSDVGTAGNLVPDAHLAALALHHHCPIVSFDRDLTRFGVDVEVPQPPD